LAGVCLVSIRAYCFCNCLCFWRCMQSV
jgi:hypothetical protein